MRILATRRDPAEPHPSRRLVDQFLRTYVSWRERCELVEAAHARWNDAARGDRGAAFAAYCAALDREQCAARAHERSIGRLRRTATRAPSSS